MQETNLIEQDQPVEIITSPVTTPAPTMTLCSYGNKLTQEELAQGMCCNFQGCWLVT